MELFDAMMDRRSIRKFDSTPVSRRELEAILEAGRQAPSSKNRQPWRFVVVQGAAKADMLAAVDAGIAREREQPLLPESARFRSGAVHTRTIMAQAPVVIFVRNPLGLPLTQTLTAEERVFELCNAQSVGACLENMALAAAGLGLGSLWICDTYFAQAELSAWLGGPGELMAALAVGHPGEAPPPRPRKPLAELTEWRTQGG